MANVSCTRKNHIGAIVGIAAGLTFLGGVAIGAGGSLSFANASDAAPKKAMDAEPSAVPNDPAAALEHAKRQGDEVPLDLTFKNAEREEITLEKMVEDGPIALIFYRGGWCPYCTGSLRKFEAASKEFESAGVKVYAITPETTNRLQGTAEKNHLDHITLLSDEGMVAGRAFGVAWKNNGYGHLDKYNGNDRREIPLGVTYVINTDGTIAWAWLDDDYKKRAEPADVVAAARKAKG